MLMRIVPKSLVALISMIMDGSNIKKKDTDEVRQATLNILIGFLTFSQTWPLQQLNSMNQMGLYVPSSCKRIYSPLLPWMTLTTARARQLPKMIFLAQAYHSFKIKLQRLTESCVTKQNYMYTRRYSKEGDTATS